MPPHPILVTGATGKQGGATARALLAAGFPVRALVRDPTTDRAKAIAALGADLVTGNLHDRDSILRAATGTRAVFSIQMPDLTNLDGDSELIQGNNLVDAARAAGVEQFVHTSVSGADQHRTAPGWTEGHWPLMEHYLETKSAIQDRVRKAGFNQWTLLKPGFFMENFRPPSLLLPHGPENGFATILRPDTELSLVAVTDIGAAAKAAFTNPDRFHEVELELASDRLTMTQIAKVLTHAFGVNLTAPAMTPAEAIAAGMPEPYLRHEWQNVIGHPARPAFARALDIPLTTFEEWATTNLTPTT